MKSNDSVYERLVNLLDNNFGYVFEEPAKDVAERIIKSGIFDSRPVVLCRDCVNYGEILSGYDHRLICHKLALTTKPNFYCAYGERRNFGSDMREDHDA